VRGSQSGHAADIRSMTDLATHYGFPMLAEPDNPFFFIVAA
jgi:hypothetical protein